MSLTHDAVKELFAPLLSPTTAPAFFAVNVAPSVVWQWGSKGATHLLAGRYEGLDAFMAGTFGRIIAMMGPMRITVESVIVDGDKAAVELRTTGTTKAGKELDDHSCWIVTAKDGKITEVVSYIDSAALVATIEDNKDLLDATVRVWIPK